MGQLQSESISTDKLEIQVELFPKELLQKEKDIKDKQH